LAVELAAALSDYAVKAVATDRKTP
jgi:hypothetical protein